MKKLTPLLFLVSFTTLAQNQGVQVQVVDEHIDSSSLEGRYQVQRTAKKSNALPDRELREEVLKDVKAVQKWDELKKDIFFMDLERKSLPELVKKYPELKESELKFLKDKR
jgi:hypothetical protein